MTTSAAELERWMRARETEHLEFKEARRDFDAEKLVRYCAALANERGGRLVLGVTDKAPRQVVGSRAFQDLEQVKHQLVDRLRLRIDVEEIEHPAGRVLVFQVPSRPIGVPIQIGGAYLMRAGESLVPMTPDLLQRIFAEAQPDHSAERCAAASLEDLEPGAIERFRAKWVVRSGRAELNGLSVVQLLTDAELLSDDGITYAALILFGRQRALGRHLAQCEVIFEYRSDEASIPYQQRLELREGFMLTEETLWSTINLRNEVFSLQEGLYRREIPAFNEHAVREAILNAVSHRDYRLPGSIFIKQFPRRIQIDSPGGFPDGITPENVVNRQAPRNRRLAEAFARCGLVERAGQGADLMFSTAVREGKLPPDFSGSDGYLVSVILDGRVKDARFLSFLEQLAAETQHALGLDDLIVLDAVHRDVRMPERVKARVGRLIEIGALERVGRNRLALASRFFAFVGRRGEYTRRRGLDRETSKALLVQHLAHRRDDGCPLSELNQVLPSMTAAHVQNLIRELKREGRAHSRGRTKAARWFPGPAPEDLRD